MPKTPCLFWPGTHRASDGRPVIGSRYVYRIVYEQKHGKLRLGLVLHHSCGNHRCINPDHLTAMQQGEHLKAHGLTGDWGQRDKTHCPKGHPYDEKNTYWYGNERHCIACRKEAKARYMKKWRKKNVSKFA